MFMSNSPGKPINMVVVAFFSGFSIPWTVPLISAPIRKPTAAPMARSTTSRFLLIIPPNDLQQRLQALFELPKVVAILLSLSCVSLSIEWHTWVSTCYIWNPANSVWMLICKIKRNLHLNIKSIVVMILATLLFQRYYKNALTYFYCFYESKYTFLLEKNKDITPIYFRQEYRQLNTLGKVIKN